MTWLSDILSFAGFMAVCALVFAWLAHGEEILVFAAAFVVAGGIEVIAMVAQ